MLNAPINVVFFAAFVTAFLKNRLRGLWDFTVFSTVCGAPVCSDFDGILRFFPCGWASVCGDFQILRFFRCVWGPCVWGLWDFTVFSLCVGLLCLGTLRFCFFLPVCEDFASLLFSPYVCGLCVYGDFEILCFSPVCGLCVGDFEIFKKSPIGKNPRCGDLKWQ